MQINDCQEIFRTKYQNFRGPPEHSAIGHSRRRDICNLLLGDYCTLQHVIQNNCYKSGFNGCFLMFVWK